MTNPTRWRAATAAATAAGMLALAACSQAPAGAPEELTMWVRAANEAKNQAVVDEWNRTHESPQIVLTAFPDDQFPTRVGTAMANDELPDILAAGAEFMPKFVDAGIFLDITDRIAGLDFADEIFPQLSAMAQDAEGRTYAVPRDPGTSMLFWNKDLFAQAGLDPDKAPATFAEVEEAAAKISALGDDTYGYYIPGNCAACLIFEFAPIMWASGGDLVDEAGWPTFTDAATEPAVAHWRTMWENGSIPPEAETDTGSNWLAPFISGKVGMAPLGSFAIGAIKEQNPDLDWGIGYIPGPDGEVSSFIGGDVVGVTSTTPHDDEAWDFVAWTLSEDVQINFVAASNELVARKDLVDNEHSRGNEAVILSNEALEFAKTPYTPFWQEFFVDPNGPYAYLMTRGIFGPSIADAMTGAQQQAEAISGPAGS